MKTIVSVCILSTLMAFLAACNDGGGSGQAGPLSAAEQKKRFQEIMTSKEEAQASIPINSPEAPDLASIQQSALAAFNGDALSAARMIGSLSVQDGEVSESRIAMQNKLTEAVETGRCAVKKEGLQGAVNAGVGPLGDMYGTLEVSGTACPVSFSLSISQEMPTEGSYGISYFAQYKVQDPAYRALNDVDSFTVKVGFGVVTKDVGLPTSTVRMSSTVDTTIHSQKYGTLVESGIGAGSGWGDSGAGNFRAGFEMKVIDSFSETSVERVAGFSMNDQGGLSFHYAVNGSPVSKEEFEGYGRLDLPVRDQ